MNWFQIPVYNTLSAEQRVRNRTASRWRGLRPQETGRRMVQRHFTPNGQNGPFPSFLRRELLVFSMGDNYWWDGCFLYFCLHFRECLSLLLKKKKIHIHMLRSNARCPVGKTILCNLVPFYLFFKNVFFCSHDVVYNRCLTVRN